MAARNEFKKTTWEDKFERKYWVSNKAKRSWIRFTKKYNNKKFRKIKGEEDS